MLRLLVALLLVGAGVAGCTSQKGGDGPTHPAAQTGAPDGGGILDLVISTGPGANQVTLRVFVFSVGGRPLQGVIVTLATTAGRIRPSRGATDVDGVFTAIMNCDGEAQITAFAEGGTDTETACGDPGATTTTTPATTPPA